MMKQLMIAAAVAATLGTAACDRAISNMQTLISDDCGRTWKEISVGGTVPARVGICALKVTVPSYPMSGEAGFRTSFANKVLTNIQIGYEYEIFDAKLFLSEARYLGRQNSAGDGEENSATKYESAENTIIERRIRETTSNVLGGQSIVEFDQAKIEDPLLDQINKSLEGRGVRLVSMQLVVIPDDQTRQAMDVASARQVYASVGLGELGDRVIVARSGATNVTVQSAAPAAASQ